MKMNERLSRLVRYFERRKDEKAMALAKVQERIRVVVEALDALHRSHRSVNRVLETMKSGLLDLERIKQSEKYKNRLRDDMNRLRAEIRTLEREAAAKRRAVEKAMKEFKMWEKLKERREQADKEELRTRGQADLDTLAMQKHHRDQTVPPAGSNHQFER
jgi:flagellar export protein FliJ